MRLLATLLLAVLLWGGRLDADLLAHYSFDEGAGAATAFNQVAGSTTGTVGTSVITGVAGISGNAYLFNNSTAQTGFDSS